MEFNPKQKEAISHIKGPCMVISCPGSGKTAILTQRVAHLIKSGYDDSRMVCITFTNKAAKEMTERIKKNLGTDKLKLYVGTFHALCVKIIRAFSSHTKYSKNFSIIDQNDQQDIILQIGRQFGYQIDRKTANSVSFHVNNWRENLEDDIDLEERFGDRSHLYDIAKEYIKRLPESNIIDFSGLLYECYWLLKNNADVLEKVQCKSEFVQVDEVQDTNLIQFKLVQLISEKHKNILCVGDISQGIYGWRGSRYQNIKDFMNSYDDCKYINLNINYRSTPQILEKAYQLIKNNTSHIGGAFETNNKPGEDIKILSFENPQKEADWVASFVSKLIKQGGWNPSDIAIFYRINSLSRAIESAFNDYGINYTMIGGRSFYERREVKDILYMLKFFVNKKDGIAFHRIANMVKGLGDVTVGKIENLAKEKNIDIINACELFKSQTKSAKTQNVCEHIVNIFNNTSLKKPAEAMDYFINKLNYYNVLNKKSKDDNDYEDRKKNVKELINSAAISGNSNYNNIDQYLQSISLFTKSDVENEESAVVLSTIHASKGLEYPIVFMIGLEHGIIPSQMTMQEYGDEGLEEERRLFFVGMTRAKKLLYLTYPLSKQVYSRQGIKNIAIKPSQFLHEINDD